jgi:Na+/melibiose symporter-like transporter
MLVELILALFCYLPNLLFQKSHPPTPPSDSGSAKREPFSKAIPALFRSRNYMLLLLAFGCYFGIFNGLSIILSYLLTPWFSSDLPMAVGVVGGSPILSGILGVIILAPMQRKSKQFKKWIVICMIGSCSAMILFYPLLETSSLALAGLVSAYNSFFLIPLVPIMLELACEVAFPVGEGSAVGLLFAIGNFSGFVLGIFLSLIVQGESKGQSAGGLGFCFGVFLLGLVLVYFMK